MLTAVLISAAAYLIVPEILNPVETLLFLWAVFVVSAMCVFWVQEQIQKIRDKRDSLCIRKNRRREKVIDFPLQSRVKHIPAFKVRA